MKTDEHPRGDKTLQRSTNLLIILLISAGVLYFAKELFVPVFLGIFLSLMLYPITAWLEKRHVPRVLAIFITFLLVSSIISGIIMFFSTHLIALFSDVNVFVAKLRAMKGESETWLTLHTPLTRKKIDAMLNQNTDLMGSAGSMFSSTVTSASGLLTTIAITMVYTFMFLVYRTSIRNFILLYFEGADKIRASHTLLEIQKVAQNYTFGLILVTLTVGTLNTIGLYFIGIDYPFLFGFFAAFLTIIPYIGTITGSVLPAAYAFLTYESHWKPALVIMLFFTVQQLEGNFISPKILGSRVSVNALFAFTALLVGGFFWGVPGMILSIPYTAMMKVVFCNIESLLKYGHLISDEFIDRDFGEFRVTQITQVNILKRRKNIK